MVARSSRSRQRKDAPGGSGDHGKQVQLMIRIALGEHAAIGPGKIRLLELINELGSISRACRAMGMSYRRAWLLVNGINDAFRADAILTRHGGSRGGGARLSPFGLDLVHNYRAIEAKARQRVTADLAELERELSSDVVGANAGDRPGCRARRP